MRLWGLAVTGLTSIALAQTSAPQNETYFTVGAGGLSTQKWLGSADIRRGGHYFATYARPEPRFTFQNHPAQLVVHGYYTFSIGGGFFGRPINHLHGYGVLVQARYWNRDDRPLPTFLEVGWGIHFANIWTEDIDTPIASSPNIGVGVLTNIAGQDVIFAARLIHTSNAGLGGRNRGQNALVFSAEFKF